MCQVSFINSHAIFSHPQCSLSLFLHPRTKYFLILIFLFFFFTFTLWPKILFYHLNSFVSLQDYNIVCNKTIIIILFDVVIYVKFTSSSAQHVVAFRFCVFTANRSQSSHSPISFTIWCGVCGLMVFELPFFFSHDIYSGSEQWPYRRANFTTYFSEHTPRYTPFIYTLAYKCYLHKQKIHHRLL